MEYLPENKTCQNCKKDFIIEPDDFLFYEKIKVPAPTFCPPCRKIRRAIWRNERSLYQSKCGLCNKNIISIFNRETIFPVYCYDCWWSDKWDPVEYGIDYNFDKPFFEQLSYLSNKVPRQALNVVSNYNSPYVNQAWHSKNSYMCFDLGYGENVLYSNACHFIKDSVDSSYSKKLDFCYECVDTRDSSISINLQNCKNCLDSFFLYDCNGCSSCILCSNLRNKSYCILNIQYTKEEYEKNKKEYIDGSFSKRLKMIGLFKELKFNSLHKENSNIQAKDCVGNNIWNCDNCKLSFNIFKSQNCKFVNDIDSDLKDSMDLNNAAEGDILYEGSAASGHNLFFNNMVASSMDVFYSLSCLQNDKNLFACISLRNKQYCILNKQYTKEEYEELVPKIIKHMSDMPYVDSKGRVYKYGEFFPTELSPFAYNETVAQEYFPLTKEQAIEKGYKWKDKEERNYNIDIHSNDIPDSITDIEDSSILNKVIECSHKGICNQQCTEAFKIIPEELSFYRRMNLPLPRLCPNCRHYERLAQRNPMKLWTRSCMKEGCTNEFETSYAPERPEIVYCEKCYQQEVY
jgi:hypothetical protein